MIYLIILLVWFIGLWKLNWSKDLPMKVCLMTFAFGAFIYLIGVINLAETLMRVSLLSGVIGVLVLTLTNGRILRD